MTAARPPGFGTLALHAGQEPDPAYHGVVFEEALRSIGNIAYIIHPATTTHSQLTPEEQAQTGVSPEFVRLSVGIEDIEDILADLDQALRASQA